MGAHRIEYRRPRCPGARDHDAVRVAQRVEIERGAFRCTLADFLGHRFGLRQQIAHAQVECLTPQLQRTLERLADAHIEPAVDAASEKVEGKAIEHRHRQHRQRDEDDEHAQCQSGTGLTCAQLACQTSDIDADQSHEGQQAGGI